MSNTNQMPATTGTRAFGTPSIGSWLSGAASQVSYPSLLVAPNHLQIAGSVSAAAVVAARNGAMAAVTGTDAARKRGRPPRGEVC